MKEHEKEEGFYYNYHKRQIVNIIVLPLFMFVCALYTVIDAAPFPSSIPTVPNWKAPEIKFKSFGLWSCEFNGNLCRKLNQLLNCKAFKCLNN